MKAGLKRRRRKLVTARLVLEPTQPAHAEGLFRATDASVDELAPWLMWAIAPSRSSTAAFTRFVAQNWEAGRGWAFTIFFEGEVAGHVELRRLRKQDHGELGYWMRSDLSGRGLMTEAAAAVVDFGFEEIGLRRIELRAGVRNAASRRVAEKLGFTRGEVIERGSRGARGDYDVYLYWLEPSTRGAAHDEEPR